MANIIGFVAAIIGAGMFIPQALQIWKTKNTKSISLVSFVMLLLTSILWLIYGFMQEAAPVIFVNFMLTVISIFIILMKMRYK